VISTPTLLTLWACSLDLPVLSYLRFYLFAFGLVLLIAAAGGFALVENFGYIGECLLNIGVHFGAYLLDILCTS